MVANFEHSAHRIVERRAANALVPASGIDTGFDSEPLRALNGAFIELLRIEAGKGEHLSLPLSLTRALPRLSTATVDVMARCPFALFDLHDAIEMRDGDAYPASRAEAAASARRQFANSALFYAWHALQTAPTRARLQLGLSIGTAQCLRAAPASGIAALADAHAHHIAPRWPQHRYFWPRLLRHAEAGEPQLSSVFWLGRQLLAAEASGSGKRPVHKACV
jgi:hypothetical protein